MSVLSKFQKGFSKSAHFISKNIRQITTNKIIDENVLQDLEEVLISADLGVDASKKLINEIKIRSIKEDININNLQIILAKEIEKILSNHEKKLEINNLNKPNVIIFVGVNGSGKTTTVAKLSKKFSERNKVLIAACDTFRAAAINQIQEWAEKNNIDLFMGKINQDPASVAFEASKKAKIDNYDILLIDTAGRLSNNRNLMDQLNKIKTVVNKSLNIEQNKIILVLDASTGSNILNQFETFNNIIGINGIIITKLDGTAKGGAIISVALKYNVPIHFIGMGEEINDLYVFKAKEFSNSLLNITS